VRARNWNRFNPVAPNPDADRKGKNNLSSHLRDTTLVRTETPELYGG